MKEIQLTKGQVALVDDADFEWLNQWKWHAKKSKATYYAARSVIVAGKKQTVRMHRQIMGVTDPNVLVDHKDLCGLHNWRSNLRTCDTLHNNWNVSSRGGASIFKGVRREGKNWLAQIKANKRRYGLGTFENEEDAARAYNQAAVRLHGDFARLNDVTPVFPTKKAAAANIGSKSGIRGCAWHKKAKTWRAQIQCNGRVLHIGLFPTPEAAGRAYDEAAKRLHGDKAVLNFPLEQQQCQ